MKKKEHAEDYYDAFISYHRVPLNNKVAKKLQDLLESPRLVKNSHYAVQDGHTLRKSKLHIFLDRAELSASSHLTGDIRDALRRSRYLIVVCTEDLKESEWCMEEIRMFLELHSGNTDKILTLLVNGKPKSILPGLPLWDFGTHMSGEGQAADDKKSADIVSADIREKNGRRILRKLKTEYLRLAAPVLGCSYDALYQRDRRRKRQRLAFILGGTLLLLTSVLTVVSVFAYRTWVSETEACSLTVLRDGENITVPISG